MSLGLIINKLKKLFHDHDYEAHMEYLYVDGDLCAIRWFDCKTCGHREKPVCLVLATKSALEQAENNKLTSKDFV